MKTVLATLKHMKSKIFSSKVFVETKRFFTCTTFPTVIVYYFTFLTTNRETPTVTNLKLAADSERQES